MFILNDKKLYNTASEIHSKYDTLLNNHQINSDEVKKYHLEKINKTIEYVRENSKFYKKHLSNVEKLKNLSDLQEVPFTTKDDLRNNTFNMLSKPLQECAFFYETTGTTGLPTPCPRDYLDVISNNIPISINFSSIIDKEDLVALCVPTELHSSGDTFGDVLKNNQISIIKMWPYSPLVGIKKSIKLLQDLQVTTIISTASMLMTFLKYIKSKNIDINTFSIKKILLTGEILSPAIQKNLEILWNADVYNCLYGSQETLVLATVRDDKKMYTFPYNYIYELIDENTLEVKNYENNEVTEGELVVSMLNQGAKPLIRYRTGDIVRMTNNSGIFTIDILGRVKDKVKINNHELYALDLENILLSDIQNYVSYQIIINNKQNKDIIILRIEPMNIEEKCFSKKEKEGLIEYFKKMYETELTIELIDLDLITSMGSMVSWKAARLIDSRDDTYKEEIKAAEYLVKTREKNFAE